MDTIGLVEIAGMVVVAAYLAWLFAFFQWLRPALMRWVGRRIGVGVRESHDIKDAGTYDTKGRASTGQQLGVIGADFLVLMIGTVGAAALVFIPAFLFAESGAPSRWDGMILGNGVRIAAIDVEPMRNGETRARVNVRADRNGARGCRLRVAGYTARNGYITGHSGYFELQPNGERTIAMPLSAARPIPGSHPIRIGVECGNRLRDRAMAALDVVR